MWNSVIANIPALPDAVRVVPAGAVLPIATLKPLPLAFNGDGVASKPPTPEISCSAEFGKLEIVPVSVPFIVALAPRNVAEPKFDNDAKVPLIPGDSATHSAELRNP